MQKKKERKKKEREWEKNRKQWRLLWERYVELQNDIWVFLLFLFIENCLNKYVSIKNHEL